MGGYLSYKLSQNYAPLHHKIVALHFQFLESSPRIASDLLVVVKSHPDMPRFPGTLPQVHNSQNFCNFAAVHCLSFLSTIEKNCGSGSNAAFVFEIKLFFSLGGGRFSGAFLSCSISSPKSLEFGYHAFLDAFFCELPHRVGNFPQVFSPVGIHTGSAPATFDRIRIPRKSGAKHRAPSVSIPVRWATVEMNPFVSRRCVGAHILLQSSWAKRSLVPQDLGDGVAAVDGLVAATTSHLVMRLRLDATA